MANSVISRSWRFFAVIILPLLISPLLFIEEDTIITEEGYSRKTTKFKTAFMIILMSLYWALELIPLTITALLPLLLFPLLGIQDIYKVSENYSKESNMIFLTGVIVAISLEYCNLHRRIALRALTLVGGTPVWLLLAIMVVASFLAMWLSSTTCAALILPTVVAIIDEVNESPEIMTKSEARRKSHASSVSMGGGGGTDGSGIRRSSIASAITSYPGERRESTAFKNAALAPPKRRSSIPSSLWTSQAQSVNPYNNPYPQENHYHKHPNKEHQGPILASPLRLKQVSLLINEARQDAPHRPHSLSLSQTTPINFTSNFKPMAISIEPPTPTDRVSPRAEEEFLDNHNGASYNHDVNFDNHFENGKTGGEILEENRIKEKIKTMFLLGISYSANIGGTAVITGAGPNKIFKEVIKPLNISQNGKYKNMTFFLWFLYNGPMMIICIFIAWLYLTVNFYGISPLKRLLGFELEEEIYKWKSRKVAKYLKDEYKKLGPIRYHETAVGAIFILVILLWILRDPELFKGWGAINTGAKSGESTGAMVGVLLLFIVPKSWSFLSTKKDEVAEFEPLLDWSMAAMKIPWSVLILLGSGFALADAIEYSGLSDWLGDELQILGGISKNLLLLIIIVTSSVVTEFVSNVACANIILPLMISLSKSLQLHPFFLTVAAAVSCSFAFCLPVSSPSNALVFAAGNFSSISMAKTGFFLNIICMGVLFGNTLLFGNYLFDGFEYEYPSGNKTMGL